MATDDITHCETTGKLNTKLDVPLEIVEPLEDLITYENDEAVFECKIDGYDQTRCLWYKDGIQIKPTQRTKITANRKWHRLEISPVRINDHGVYTIICKNNVNHISSKATLHVAPSKSNNLNLVLYTHSLPKRCLGVTRHLSNVKATFGDTIQLQVKFQTDTNRDCVWFKNNEIINQDDRHAICNTDKSSSLIIIGTEMTDSGIYYVVSRTKYGILSSLTDVLITEELTKDVDSDIIPSIEEHLPDELETNEKEEIRLICQANIDINTTVEWFKNKESIDIENSHMIAEDYGNHHIGLRIEEPSRKDTAEYSIILRDATSGRVDTSNCYLTVNNSPMITPPVVPLRRPLESAIACCGARVSFDCSFSLEDPKYFYVVWYIGHFRVERTNSRFNVVCKGGEFLIYINKLEPDMAGEVVCELRRSLPHQKSVLVNNTISSLAIVPPCVIEKETTNTSFRSGKIYNEPSDGARICDTKQNGLGNNHFTLNGAMGNGHTDKQLENEIILEITYCRLEEDGLYFLHLTKGNDDITTSQLMVNDEVQKSSDNVKTVIFEWEDSILPTTVWYSIELCQNNGQFIEAGVTSAPMFEVQDPQVGSIIKFRIRTVKPMNHWSESRVTIVPTSGELPKPEKTHELKPMEHFEPIYTKTGDLIGCGAFGSVVLVHNKNGQHFAAKILKTRTQKKRDTALREYEMMKRLRHPKLVELSDAFIARDSFIFVMDYLWGGELFDRIVEEEHIKEEDVVPYVRQICEALEYLHFNKIAHLDLKPENIICLSPNSGQVKIIDFGLARVLEEGHVTRAIYGTRDYVAPEVLNFESLTLGCDMWSLGVVTYMLLSGVMPFAGETWPERSANIIMANYNYDETAFSEISDLAKDFVDQLLVQTPDKRMSATGALKHKWILEGPPKGMKAGYMKRARENLKSYLANYRARWQRAGNVMIAALRLRSHASGLRAANASSVSSPRVT